MAKDKHVTAQMTEFARLLAEALLGDDAARKLGPDRVKKTAKILEAVVDVATSCAVVRVEKELLEGRIER